MPSVTCCVCKRTFEVKPYRIKSAKTCSGKCRAAMVGRMLTGRKIKGHPAWNRGMKGIHLSPSSEFKKGMKPWNRDLKGIHLSPETEFKDGHDRTVRMNQGEMRIRTHKGVRRRWVKVNHVGAIGIWMLNARWVWTQANGEIPKGKVIHHDDRNTLNDAIWNLRCLTKAEHAKEHANDKISL